MRAVPATLLLLGVAVAVSGCFGPFLWAADLLHPASVSSIDVVWSEDRAFCELLISRSRRSAFLISGNMDDTGFRPSSSGHYRMGSTLSPKDPWRDGNRPDHSIQQFVVKESTTYLYAGKAPISTSETRHLPIPAAEQDYADEAMLSAWRESLFRLHDDGTATKECTFMGRLWINWVL